MSLSCLLASSCIAECLLLSRTSADGEADVISLDFELDRKELVFESVRF